MPLEKPTSPAHKTSIKLSALTAVVLLAHAGLLYGTPSAVATPGYRPEVAFTTQMIAPAPASQLQPPEALPPSLPPPRAQARSSSIVLAAATQSPAPTQDADPGPEANTAQDAANAISPTEAAPAASAHGFMSQLLAASGPPANLKPPSDATPLAAGEESKPSAGGGAGGSASKPATANASALSFAFPPPMHLKYKINGEVKGFSYHVNGDLQWKQDGKTYEARMEVSHFLLGSRVQTSRGDLGATGLEPVRFGDKVRSERAAHFERSKGKVTFSANSPDAPLVSGTQDQLSTLLQLGAMLGGAPGNFPEGTIIPFESVGPTSVESWVFKVGPQEKLNLPGGQVSAIKLVREAVGDYGTRGEVWLAPSMGYLPVRIRLIEPNGNFVDQKWLDTVAP